MLKLIRRLFRLAVGLLLIAVALAVAAVLLLDTVAQQVVQSRLRSETGMDVKIGRMQIGLSTPTIAIEDLKIYNTPEFGGSLFLNIPEIYADYDPEAIRARKLHLNLVRINLAEINIVQDKNGRLNIQSLKEKTRTATNAPELVSNVFGVEGTRPRFHRHELKHLERDAAKAAQVENGLAQPGGGNQFRRDQ
jgi:hypothetical protein